MNNEAFDGSKRMEAILLECRCSPRKYLGELVGLVNSLKGTGLYVHIVNVSGTSILC